MSHRSKDAKKHEVKKKAKLTIKEKRKQKKEKHKSEWNFFWRKNEVKRTIHC